MTAARSTQTPTSIYRIQHLTTSAAHHHLRSSGAQYRPDGKSSYGESEPSRSQGNKPEAESIAPVVSIDLFRILDPKYNSVTHFLHSPSELQTSSLCNHNVIKPDTTRHTSRTYIVAHPQAPVLRRYASTPGSPGANLAML